MDPNIAQQDTNAQPPKSLISLEDAQAVFTELGLQNLPEDKKSQMLETMIDTVMDRIFQRIEPTLSENDKKMLTDLEMRPDADNAMVNYLVAIVPNLDAIATEEIMNYKRELKSQISDIMNVYDEEMGKKAGELSAAPQVNVSEPPAPASTEEPVQVPMVDLPPAPELVAPDTAPTPAVSSDQNSQPPNFISAGAGEVSSPTPPTQDVPQQNNQ